NGVYAFDTVAAELFCMVDSPAVSYANFEFVSTPPYTGRITAPLYNFYFSHPVEIGPRERFYVGVRNSYYNRYNNSDKITHECTDCGYRAVHIWAPHSFPLIDSTWGIYLYDDTYSLDIAHDWRVPRAYAEGFLPISAPPDRSIRQNHIHDAPLTAAVPNFHLASTAGNHPTLAWDSVESDFGLAGADVDLFEVQYTLYDSSYASGRSVLTPRFSTTILDTLVPEVYYKFHVRCRNHHRCDIHDTLVWGPWSREVYFRSGDTLPDCRKVEGFRFLGHRMNRPYFSWEMQDPHTSYEIQCSLFDSNEWSSTYVDRRGSYVLPRGFQQAGTYKARIRAHCLHQCQMHDTTLWGPWSDLAVFYSSGQWTEADTGEVGIAAPEATTAFTLSPNPTNGEVTVVLPALGEGAVLTVADATGREVRRQTLPPAAEASRLRLDLKGLPAGAYFVTVVTPQGSHTEKLVIGEF
ncbi:MAG: T9SS type A sorting domain-containing protein, partial [Bacteroidales bacterium]|nr:T9SS type A sorting domain-containing protein [Bacteroidales bacterium]